MNSKTFLCGECKNNMGQPKGYDNDIDPKGFDLNCKVYGDIDGLYRCKKFKGKVD